MRAARSSLFGHSLQLRVLCRKDWIFFRKEALVSWRTAQSAQDPTAPSALTDPGLAIYTRVSTDQGLEQDFNSVDAQREACEAYVKSQSHEGWRLIRDRYDDRGFSGGSMERPALQKLLRRREGQTDRRDCRL